jgi:hypothetical protein
LVAIIKFMRLSRKKQDAQGLKAWLKALNIFGSDGTTKVVP